MQEYYRSVQRDGNLLTAEHAQRWSDATLRTLGLNLDRGTKRALARVLPVELASQLNGVFWLAHFRDKSLPAAEFQKMVARRSGNTDADFARHPVVAVFKQLKASYVDANLSERVAQSLAPEIRALWKQA